jgi:hypothetical protein
MTLALRESVKRRRELDELMGTPENFMAKVEKGEVSDEEIVNLVFRQGNKANRPLLREIRDFFGKDSPEWREIQNDAMTRIVKSMETESDDAVSTFINGQALDAVIESYGISQLNIMFGRELAGDLVEFGKTVKFLTTRETLSGGIVAANIALSPIQNAPKLVWLSVLGKMMAQPGVIRYFTQGLKLRKTRQGVAAMTRFVTDAMLMSESVSAEQQ